MSASPPALSNPTGSPKKNAAGSDHLPPVIGKKSGSGTDPVSVTTAATATAVTNAAATAATTTAAATAATAATTTAAATAATAAAKATAAKATAAATTAAAATATATATATDPKEKPEKGFAYVSQAPFWKGNMDMNNNNNDNRDPKAVFLSYDLFLGLSVLGGFFALDHLYLRSPLTFLAKLIINFMFFGIWWLYDAMQAVFHGDVVQTYGLGVPGLGPKGIAGGVLSREVPDKKHLNFFIYAIALMLGGIFGADSFLVGDKQSGFIRIIMLVSVVLAPCAMIWWGYNVFKFYFNTKGLVSENGNYFGVPQSSMFSKMFPWINDLNPLAWIQSFLNTLFGAPIIALTEAFDKTATAIDGASKTADRGFTALQVTAKAIPETIEQISKLGSAAPGKSMLDAALSGAPKAEPTAAELAAAPVQNAAAQKAAVKTGGSQESGLNILPYTLLGTVAAIAAAGFGTTYYRSKNVATPQRDDTPPEPGVLRKPDQKGRAA
jgi:TM2 domain-containing membrane protein YozV